jgi:hypothetical protein
LKTVRDNKLDLIPAPRFQVKALPSTQTVCRGTNASFTFDLDHDGTADDFTVDGPCTKNGNTVVCDNVGAGNTPVKVRAKFGKGKGKACDSDPISLGLSVDEEAEVTVVGEPATEDDDICPEKPSTGTVSFKVKTSGAAKELAGSVGQGGGACTVDKDGAADDDSAWKVTCTGLPDGDHTLEFNGKSKDKGEEGIRRLRGRGAAASLPAPAWWRPAFVCWPLACSSRQHAWRLHA